MILTFMSQNLWYGGLQDGDGNYADRWPDLRQRIENNGATIDFLLLQEAWGWGDNGHRQLARARDDLAMDATPLPPSSSGNGTALLYRPSTVGQWKRWNTDHAELTLQGFGVATFDIGLPEHLSVTSTHLDAFGSNRALLEIELLIRRAYRYGSYAVMGGDFNYTSSQAPDPDYSNSPMYNVMQRTKLDFEYNDEDAKLPDRRIGHKMRRGGFVDVAHYLYEKTADEKYLEGTAKNPTDRIDQFWVSKPLAPAITSYWIVREPTAASDHKGIVFQLDTDLIEPQR